VREVFTYMHMYKNAHAYTLCMHAYTFTHQPSDYHRSVCEFAVFVGGVCACAGLRADTQKDIHIQKDKRAAALILRDMYMHTDRQT
jgi:hypothetical protein